jgi:hypothetical protein
VYSDVGQSCTYICQSVCVILLGVNRCLGMSQKDQISAKVVGEMVGFCTHAASSRRFRSLLELGVLATFRKQRLSI